MLIAFHLLFSYLLLSWIYACKIWIFLSWKLIADRQKGWNYRILIFIGWTFKHFNDEYSSCSRLCFLRDCFSGKLFIWSSCFFDFFGPYLFHLLSFVSISFEGLKFMERGYKFSSFLYSNSNFFFKMNY